MRVGIEYLTEHLSQAAAIVAIVGQDCYFVAAPQELSKNNFIAFNLSKRNVGTKDASVYDVRVSVCHNTIDGLITNGDVVESHLETKDRLNFEGTSDVVFVQDQFFQLDYNYTLTTF